ncbi:MAG: transporter [Planctomycetota bacterium]|nr:MAG: transporter [Planctomycetota bacterium]
MHKFKSRSSSTVVGVVCAAMLFMTSSVSAIDVDAGDYEAAPPGTNLGLLYLQHASRDGLNTNIGIYRAVHFMEIGGMTADPQILIPFGSLEGRGTLADALGETRGVGDVILASTFWPQNDPERGVWTGFTPYLYVPTGKYDRDSPLNLGENRWKFNLQVAHVRRLSERFSVDLVADVMFHGDNEDFGPDSQNLSQDPLYQAQGWLRYHTSPTSDFRFLVSHVWGGESSVDGLKLDDESSTTKIGIGGSFFIGDKTQIVAIAGRDLSTNNDLLKENGRVNLRILRIF